MFDVIMPLNGRYVQFLQPGYDVALVHGKWFEDEHMYYCDSSTCEFAFDIAHVLMRRVYTENLRRINTCTFDQSVHMYTCDRYIQSIFTMHYFDLLSYVILCS